MAAHHGEQANEPFDEREGSVMRSHEVAELTGVTVRALRHYHRIGLLPEPPRDSNGYRRYRAAHAVRVLQIRRYADSGMPLRSIAEVVGAEGTESESALAALDRRLEERAEQIARQRRLLASLRAEQAPVEQWYSRSGGGATRALDRDVWTLVSGTGQVPQAQVEALSQLFASPELGEAARAWIGDFEGLEGAAEVDVEQAENLADRMAEFYRAVSAGMEAGPDAPEVPVMGMAQQLLDERLSPAQRQVWAAFAERAATWQAAEGRRSACIRGGRGQKMNARGPSPQEAMMIDPSTTALVLIEFQNDFTSEGGTLHDAVAEVMNATDTLPNGEKALEASRSAGLTIVHSPIAFQPGYFEISAHPYGILKGVVDSSSFVKDTWGSAIVDSMAPTGEDIVLEGKRGLDAFGSTNLDFILRSKGITTIVLAGFLTNCCVESTMRSAYEKGYEVFTLTDAVGATSLEEHENAIKFDYPMFSKPLSTDDYLATLTGDNAAADSSRAYT